MVSPLAFVHIPKTGGTTLRNILRKQYGGAHNTTGVRAFRPGELEERVREKEEDIKSKELLYGHMIFGAHELLSRNWHYVALVREAIDRVISDYYYVRRTPDHDFYDPVVTEEYSLEEYVRSGITIYTNNVQTRMLAGVGREVPFGECTEEMLDRAIDNVEEYFPVVGTTDRFAESVVLMKRRLGWGVPAYKTRNRTSGRPGRREVADSVREVIREYNRLDERLYEYASERLDTQISEENPVAFRRDLQTLQVVNTIYAPSVRAYVWLRGTYNQIVGKTEW